MFYALYLCFLVLFETCTFEYTGGLAAVASHSFAPASPSTWAAERTRSGSGKELVLTKFAELSEAGAVQTSAKLVDRPKSLQTEHTQYTRKTRHRHCRERAFRSFLSLKHETSQTQPGQGGGLRLCICRRSRSWPCGVVVYPE